MTPAEPSADIEALVARLEASPDEATKAAARDALAAVLGLHGRGLVRVLEIVRRAGEPGDAILERMAEDPLVGSLLVLHDLHPSGLSDRAAAAVQRLRAAYPDLELVEVRRGRVRVRLGVRGGGTAAIRSVEAALLEAVPDAHAIDVATERLSELVSLRRKEIRE